MGMIISGFPGIGKTTLQKNNSSVIDLESSDFKWIYQDSETESMDKEKRKGTDNRIVSPLWPMNYVQEIIKKAKEYDIVLISQNPEVRECLKENKCTYYVCFPKKECKQEYIERYRSRGNNEKFISLISENFESWIEAAEKEDNKLIMEPGEYLEDTLKRYKQLNK